MRSTAILLLITCLAISTIQLDQSSIPCNDQVFFEAGWTVTTAPTGGANDITLGKASLTISGQNYDTYSGNWQAAIGNAISFSVTGYSAVATKTYLFGLRATKNVTFSTTQSGVITYNGYQSSLGYIATFALKGSVSTITVTMTAREASTSANPNEIALTFAKASPPDSTFSCKESCSAALNAVTFSGVQYPGAFCGTAATGIPSFNFNAPPSNNGLGSLAEHPLNPCAGNPITTLVTPGNASWSIALSDNDSGAVAALSEVAKGSGKFYQTTWTGVDIDDDFEFEIIAPYDASASQTTKNNQSYILGFQTNKNITLTVKTPTTAALTQTSVGGTTIEVENIMVTQTYNQTDTQFNKNSFITFRGHALRLANADSSSRFVITARSRQKDTSVSPAVPFSSLTLKFYLGQYYPPNLELNCSNPCNQSLSAFVLFGQRFVGAICWETNASFLFALFMVLALVL